MVDIFRNSEAAGPITDDAIKAGAKIVWMQPARNNAAKRAEDAGRVVMNRCPKIRVRRISELGWHGINSHVITSKRRRLAEERLNNRKLGLETLSVHTRRSIHDRRAADADIPNFVFRLDADHAASLFNLQLPFHLFP